MPPVRKIRTPSSTEISGKSTRSRSQTTTLPNGGDGWDDGHGLPDWRVRVTVLGLGVGFDVAAGRLVGATVGALSAASGNRTSNDPVITTAMLERVADTTGKWEAGGVTLRLGSATDPARLRWLEHDLAAARNAT